MHARYPRAHRPASHEGRIAARRMSCPGAQVGDSRWRRVGPCGRRRATEPNVASRPCPPASHRRPPCQRPHWPSELVDRRLEPAGSFSRPALRGPRPRRRECLPEGQRGDPRAAAGDRTRRRRPSRGRRVLDRHLPRRPRAARAHLLPRPAVGRPAHCAKAAPAGCPCPPLAPGWSPSPSSSPRSRSEPSPSTRCSRGGLDPQLAATLIHANDISFVATWAIDAVFLAATAATALRTGALPRWAGWSAAAIAPAMLAGVAMATSDSAQLPTALFLFWIVGVSIHLLRRPDGIAEAESIRTPRAQPILG